MEIKPNKTKRYLTISGIALVILALAVSGGMSWFLYQQTVDLLTSNLKERLLSIATTAVTQIDPNDVNALQIEEDYTKPEWTRVVNQMRKVRRNNKDIIFIYLFRRSKNDPSQMIFVADSHSLNPYANVDSNVSHRVDPNGDGIINDTDVLQWPGQPYEPPDEAYEAYNGAATTNKDLYSDSWGTYITGYAPILDDRGAVVGVLAVDVQASDFSTLTTQTLTPFLTFILALVGVLLILAYGLIKIWTRQVDLVEELDKQKDEVLNMVAHQLATPVTAVRWTAEQLLDEDEQKLTKSQKEALSTIQTETADLAGLIAMILDVSRIQLGKVQIHKEPLDLNIFFNKIWELIEIKAQEHNVYLKKTIKPEKLPTVMLDNQYTRMAVQNLLTNAVKYSPEGGNVDFTVEIKDNILHCTVKDNGCGIPKKEQEKVFGRLFRASNVQRKEGNGFGLYIAKGAIVAQGGSIWFESEENKGTTFHIELPIFSES
jgi:signal transduction histidine kinase